ncbi:hypothetical protein HQ584_01750 [Patescibacteria group bacterium]|nr:hypothetical protein [Patescibacteria group bacterium]
MTRQKKADSIPQLQNYDWAIPQSYWNEVYEKTGLNPAGEIVWRYDNSLFGMPFSISLMGWIILRIMSI